MMSPEEKKERKIKRLLKKSAWGFGIGVGLLLLNLFVAPHLGENELAQKTLGLFSWCLAAYGVLMFATFAFKRELLAKLDLLLCWIVLPTLLLKLVMDL